MCDCAQRTEDALKATNTALDIRFTLDRQTQQVVLVPVIATSKRDSKCREKAQTLLPTYCPFCGVKYA